MKKHCQSQYQKAIAKLAFAIGYRQPVKDWRWEKIGELFLHYLKSNEKIVLKYLRMGESTFKTKCEKERGKI